MPANPQRLNIYLTDTARQQLNELADILDKQGVKEVKDNRGRVSLSAMVRYLVENELYRQGKRKP